MSKGFACVALDRPKFDSNVGGAIRASGIYEVSLIVVASQRFKREPTDTMNAYKSVPMLKVADVFDAIPYDCVPVAVDLIEGATSLPRYVHPAQAFYIFGGEDATLGRRITERCRDVVYIPTKGCMNLAATVNVVLYDRLMKETT